MTQLAGRKNSAKTGEHFFFSPVLADQAR